MTTITTALLLAGLALPGIPAEQGGNGQPDTVYRQAPGIFYVGAAGRSYLGVDIQDVTAERVNALKLKEERGVEITMVDQDAPAGKAGLKEHDVILEFNGTAVESEEQLRRLIREVPPGRNVALAISRDGNPMKINVQLADYGTVVKQSRTPRVVPVPRIRIHPPNGMDLPAFQLQQYSSVLGVQTENLTRQLGEFFGVKDGEGVLVRSVEKGSAAEKAGLKAGDVIVRADNEKLTDRTDLSHILRNHRSGGKMTLVVMRDKKEQTLQVTLPDRGSRDSSLLDFDSEELMASLGNAESMVLDLQDDEGLLSLGDQLTDLQGKLNMLEWDQKSNEFKDLTPELENAIREAEKALKQHLKASDPI